LGKEARVTSNKNVTEIGTHEIRRFPDTWQDPQERLASVFGLSAAFGFAVLGLCVKQPYGILAVVPADGTKFL
jgi:hypothetical protein